MSFREELLQSPRPASVRSVKLPRRQKFYPSPVGWQDEVIYFLLPDRFSDGNEAQRPLVDRSNLNTGRPSGFRFDRWAEGGGNRWQGGTLKGIASKLGYLEGLGVTTLWIGPVFKQRAHLDTFHGYAIQDFLDVDPRFGTRQDLVDLVQAAHRKELRVILDVVFNHSGSNWVYEGNAREKPFVGFPAFYGKGPWLDASGNPISELTPAQSDAGVWPAELQSDDCYTRAGGVDFTGSLDDPHAPFRRTDFFDLRDFNFDGNDLLDDLARCYKYWIALTDCDGLRLDTLKHVPVSVARNFCGAIKEYAVTLGKAEFFLVGEVAGSDEDARKYRDVLGLNLNATLDIGGMRRILHDVAKGLREPSAYLSLSGMHVDDLGSHRDLGARHVSVLDDHDHVSGNKVRFSTDAASPWQVVAGVALQLFTLGIPCIYYGSEQALAGPEKAVRDKFLPDFNPDTSTDKYLREAMFGPEHPLKGGRGGLPNGSSSVDASLPGFGPFGTVGRHCFDTKSPAYTRIAALLEVRKRFPVLRTGRQYQRPISNFDAPFALPAAGELIAWSRILDDEEALCIVNGHGVERRGANVVVDARTNRVGSHFEVIANSEQAGTGRTGTNPIGRRFPVQSRGGVAYVEIRDIGPSEVLVLDNRP